MTKVTILLILAVLAYAGAGYSAIRWQIRLNNRLWLKLSDKDDELAGDKRMRLQESLTFEYNQKTGINIYNKVLRWLCIVLSVTIWPVMVLKAAGHEYWVYRKLMKKATTN